MSVILSRTLPRALLPSILSRSQRRHQGFASVGTRITTNSPSRPVRGVPRERAVFLTRPQSPGVRRFSVTRAAATPTGYAPIECGGLSVELVPLLQDNYAYLIHDQEQGVTGIVDPAEAEPVLAALAARNLKLDYILNTHHHLDHVGGNEQLKQETGAPIVGPYADRERIPGIDTALKDGEVWQFGSQEVHVLDTPGHTKGHICFHLPKAKVVFTGDTLFALGCGRLFEGTAEEMFHSLAKLKALPGETQVFCGHEYTQANARFCLTVDSTNDALTARSRHITLLRRAGLPTIPSSIQLELDTNPMLRASSVDEFAKVRRAKDKF